MPPRGKMRQGLTGLRLDHFHSAIHHLHFHHPRGRDLDSVPGKTHKKTVDWALLMSEVSIEAIEVSTKITKSSQIFPLGFSAGNTFNVWCFAELLWQAARGAKAGKSLSKAMERHERRCMGNGWFAMLICHVYIICVIIVLEKLYI